MSNEPSGHPVPNSEAVGVDYVPPSPEEPETPDEPETPPIPEPEPAPEPQA